MSSVLSGQAPPNAASGPSLPLTAPLAPRAAPPAPGGPPRNNTLTVLAGVGVLLLAMGVGVLIGRAGSPKQGAPPAQTISLAGPTSTSSASGGSGEAAFTGDWPSATSGYTVQLQTLAQSGSTVGAVEAAKSAVSAKGAKSVGALKSEEFTSLSPGSYVIYSGVYHNKPEAEKALSGLRKSFPGAKVIKVSNGASSKPAEGSGSGSAGVPPSSLSHPAPPSALKGLKGTKGKTYEERSKNLPNVVETG
jgi:hypothetical protein